MTLYLIMSDSIMSVMTMKPGLGMLVELTNGFVEECGNLDNRMNVANPATGKGYHRFPPSGTSIDTCCSRREERRLATNYNGEPDG